jgi:hypothetical protein
MVLFKLNLKHGGTNAKKKLHSGGDSGPVTRTIRKVLTLMQCLDTNQNVRFCDDEIDYKAGYSRKCLGHKYDENDWNMDVHPLALRASKKDKSYTFAR